MKVLGLRVDPKKTRYAILQSDGNGSFTLLNSDGESQLLYPANISELTEKLVWLFEELERLFRAHSDIEKICLKTNEFTQQDTKSKRESSYLEGAVLLFGGQRHIPVTTKLYASLSTRGNDAKHHAEERVGRTEKYWDSKMADAILAAWKGAQG